MCFVGNKRRKTSLGAFEEQRANGNKGSSRLRYKKKRNAE